MSSTKSNDKKLVRGREATERRILDAVGNVLSVDGFKGLGVNRIAREAGVDKVLIYRYFGSLSGLVSCFGSSKRYWPSVEELVAPASMGQGKHTVSSMLGCFFSNYIRAILKRPMTLDIMAWEMTSHDKLTQSLEDVRLKTALKCFERMDLDMPDGVDGSALVVVLFGAVNALLVKSKVAGAVGGIDLKTEAGWSRIEKTVEVLLRGLK